MKKYEFPVKNKLTVLALGAESAGNFSVYKDGIINHSDDFGDLLVDTKYNEYENELNEFLLKNKIKPDVILTDLHPLYRTTELGKGLGRKNDSKLVQVQHHIAHSFSAIGQNMMQASRLRITDYGLQNSYCIALDGTGYGQDGKIWGGEIFKLQVTSYKLQADRIGHLENQIMIGGDLSVKEPARMLISILNNFLDKDELFKYVKKYYDKNAFEVLYNQLDQNFNCQETSSAGRILDAISVLLEFSGNTRDKKHGPALVLEQNSTKRYSDLEPKIKKYRVNSVFNENQKKLRVTNYELLTTPLFEYLIKNLDKDKKRLAATAQLYIAKGLEKIIKLHSHPEPGEGSLNSSPSAHSDIIISGGISNNKIISEYFQSKGAFVSKKIPRGDAGLSFGQIVYYLLTQPKPKLIE